MTNHMSVASAPAFIPSREVAAEEPGALILTPVSIVLTGPCHRLFAPAVGFLSHQLEQTLLQLGLA